MAEYMIAANAEWVPDFTPEEMSERGTAVKAVVDEMKAAGVYVFLGGLDDAPVVSIDVSGGVPVVTDGPFVETREHLGDFAIIDVADGDAARAWAEKITAACGWPHELRRFQVPM